MRLFSIGTTQGSPPSDELVSWMSNPPKNPNLTTVTFDTVRQKYTTEQVWHELLLREIQDTLRGRKVVTASLNTEFPQGQRHGISGIGQNLDSFIQSLSIERPIELRLSSLLAGGIYTSVGDVKLHIDNCSIAHLQFLGVAAEVTLLDTHVGNLEIAPAALKHYEMKGGSLLNVNCPPPSDGNPFIGTVSFKNVFFPRKRKVFILQGPQPYRNMRHHLRNLENAQMANLIHSAELAVEREDDSWTNRILSYLYEWLSDFGSSALTPLLWQVFLLSLSMSLIFYSDGAVLAFSESAPALVGWQTILIDTNESGDLARAVYLALQPVVNPIGIFGPKSLLVPRYPWLAVWLSLHGVLSVILLALLIFAIRRRFKIQQ